MFSAPRRKPPVLAQSAGLKWGPAPDALPKGATMTVVAGDPTKSGPYILRAKVPAGYRVMAHWHPTDENVTVLSGTAAFGMGDAVNEADAKKAGYHAAKKQ